MKIKNKSKIYWGYLSLLITGSVIFIVGLFEKGIETNLGWIKPLSCFGFIVIACAVTLIKLDQIKEEMRKRIVPKNEIN